MEKKNLSYKIRTFDFEKGVKMALLWEISHKIFQKCQKLAKKGPFAPKSNKMDPLRLESRETAFLWEISHKIFENFPILFSLSFQRANFKKVVKAFFG